MKPILGHRGENVVGDDTLAFQYPSPAFGMEMDHYI